MTNPIGFVAGTIAGLVLGAIPFAYIIVRVGRHEDIRLFGSHNPGGMNVWRSLGWPYGVAVITLDFAKGVLPVWLAVWAADIGGWWLVPIALAPIIGHAYTPFLRGRGGKAVAVSFGVWAGLMGWPGILLLALAQGTFLAVWRADSWVSTAGAALFVLFLWITGASPQYLLIAVLDGMVMAQRYWPEFKMGLRPRFAKEGG